MAADMSIFRIQSSGGCGLFSCSDEVRREFGVSSVPNNGNSNLAPDLLPKFGG
jgi:hypothetical protein